MSSIDCSSFNLFIMFCVIYTYTYVMYKAGWFPVQLEQFHHIILCIELYIHIIYNFRFWRQTTIFFPNQKNSTFTIDTPILNWQSIINITLYLLLDVLILRKFGITLMRKGKSHQGLAKCDLPKVHYNRPRCSKAERRAHSGMSFWISNSVDTDLLS